MPDHLVSAGVRAVLSTAIGLAWTVALLRMVGLRGLSKMTAFDFVVTVAAGSILAGAATASSNEAFLRALLAMGTLFACQFGLAWLRSRSEAFQHLLDNPPAELWRDGRPDLEALRQHRMTRGDVIAKLREANALDPKEVHHVVLEATGDVSVLHGADAPAEVLVPTSRPASH